MTRIFVEMKASYCQASYGVVGFIRNNSYFFCVSWYKVTRFIENKIFTRIYKKEPTNSAYKLAFLYFSIKKERLQNYLI